MVMVMMHRFVDSEIELHATVKDAHALAGAPHLYEQLIAWNFFKDLLGLISHDNLGMYRDGGGDS